MDVGTLEPMNCFMFHPLWSKEWIEKIEKAIQKVAEEKISLKALARTISGPTHLRAQLLFLLLDLKCARIEKERRLKIANFFLNLLLAKATDDPYGWKSNKMHTPGEIKELAKKIKFNPGREEAAKLLGRLYTAAYHLINGLYTDFYTDFGVECFGEYSVEELGDGYTSVIKQFNDLKPELLWPDLKSPCKKLVIYSVYKDVKFTCDAISVHSVYEGDPIKGLVRWAVEVDGKFIDSIEEIKKLKESFEALSIEQWQKLTSLGFEELKKKGLVMRNYTFKKMFDELGMAWQPDEKMSLAVKNKPWIEEDYWGMPKSQEKEFWHKLMDPEIDFYPLKS